MSWGDGGRAKVLIVDDETGITTMLAERLEHAGYIPLVANDATRALALVRSRAPDVILTDHYMPNVDGATLIQMLRDEGCQTPVILMSAGIEGEVAALRAQATAYLEKPFQMNRAIEAIEQALGGAADDGA